MKFKYFQFMVLIVDVSVLSITYFLFQKKNKLLLGYQSAEFKSAKSGAHLECLLTSGKLGESSMQRCDKTTLQMHTFLQKTKTLRTLNLHTGCFAYCKALWGIEGPVNSNSASFDLTKRRTQFVRLGLKTRLRCTKWWKAKNFFFFWPNMQYCSWLCDKVTRLLNP